MTAPPPVKLSGRNPTGQRRAVGERRTVGALVATVALMLGLVSYSPTLYRLFCEITGYNGTTQRVSSAPTEVSDRVITIRFIADIQPDLPWLFAPAERSTDVKVGEQRLAFYVAESRSRERTSGVAVFNVTPLKAAQYFDKIACFCFDEQHLAPGQRVDMPVSFFVDPKILKDRNLDDVTEITLSYTFYRSTAEKRAETPAPAAPPAPN